MIDYSGKHIVFILPNMEGGGTERVVSQLANTYINMGIQVSLLLFAGNCVKYDLDKKIKVECVGEKSEGNLFNIIKKTFALRKYFKNNKDCYVFSFAAMGAVFTRLTSFGCNIKMLVSERNDPRVFEHKIIRNWGYEKASVIVTQTEEMLKYLPSRFDSKKTVIPNPVPDNILGKFNGMRTRRIVSVGRLEPQKNQKLLLEAFAEFVKTHKDYVLDIYGDGQLRSELENYAKTLRIDSKVRFNGFCSDVREKIHDAQMFVMSSDYEGISNAMIEAVAMGIPTICTDCPVGGARMYIEDGISGILVPVGDVAKLTQAMIKVADNTDWAEELAHEAIKVRSKYPNSVIARRFLDAIY